MWLYTVSIQQHTQRRRVNALNAHNGKYFFPSSSKFTRTIEEKGSFLWLTHTSRCTYRSRPASRPWVRSSVNQIINKNIFGICIRATGRNGIFSGFPLAHSLIFWWFSWSHWCAQHVYVYICIYVYEAPISFEREGERKNWMPSHTQIIVNIYRFCSEMCISVSKIYVPQSFSLSLWIQARLAHQIVVNQKIVFVCFYMRMYTANYLIYCHRLRPKKKAEKNVYFACNSINSEHSMYMCAFFSPH